MSSAAKIKLAFSRILSNTEIVIIINTTNESQKLHCIVDHVFPQVGDTFNILYSNKPAYTPTGKVEDEENTIIFNLDGSVVNGSARAISLTLQPMEVQILG